MIRHCVQCGMGYEYNDEVGYSEELCGPFCDGVRSQKTKIADLEQRLRKEELSHARTSKMLGVVRQELADTSLALVKNRRTDHD